MKLRGKQLAYLRSLAHHLKPCVIIGKTGLTPSSINSIDGALNHHELIKIKFLSGNKNDIIDTLVKKNKCIIVGSIGKTLIIYKKSLDEKKRTIKIPF